MEGLGHSVLGLFFSFYASDPCLAFFNKYGDIAGLGGISYVSPIEGSIWMICTPHIKKNPVTFVKQCKKWLSEQKQYKILTNKVEKEEKVEKELTIDEKIKLAQEKKKQKDLEKQKLKEEKQKLKEEKQKSKNI